MEIKAFVQDFDHWKKFHCRTPFAEQLFAVHLLVEHLLKADPIKLEIM